MPALCQRPRFSPADGLIFNNHFTSPVRSFLLLLRIRSLFQSLASLKASTTLHDSMTQRVMRAPVGWFERTPLGRILNRFSSDIQEVDKDVMDALGSTLVCTFSALSIVVVISYTVSSRVLTCTAKED